jgi:serine/threonine protein kinase
MHFLASPIIRDAPISSPKGVVSTTNKMGANWWERVVVQRSVHSIEALVENMTERSRFLKEACPPMTAASLAILTRDEVQEGALLGRGTYSEVYEVKNLTLCDSDDDSDDNSEADAMLENLCCEEINVGLVARAARQTLQTKLREGKNQYAIKHLKPELLKDPKAFESAAADLIMEARFMTMLSHPNILNMSGVAMGGTAAYGCSGLFDAFFIIVERLEVTLDERLREWRRQSATHCCDVRNASLELKMNLALQLGSALAYLHDRRLVFRDLKPHNCGLTKEGRLKLFDFGFCRELPQNDCQGSKTYVEPWNETKDHENDDRMYGMSGKGTVSCRSFG